MGETLAGYINRLRLEKAASMLAYNPDESITSIAYECGYSSSAHFARAFRVHFGCSASELRRRQKSKIVQRVRKMRKASPADDGHDGNRTTTEDVGMANRRNIEVEVETLPTLRVAYVRHLGNYEVEAMWSVWERLMRWATAHELMGQDAEFIGIPHDDPEFTPRGRCRYDACVVVSSEVQASGEVGIMEIPGGRYGRWTTEVSADGVWDAWDELYLSWLLDSGFQPDSRPCLEFYGDGSSSDPDGPYVVKLSLPVKPL